MDLGLTGKTVLITGSSRGIGLATAKIFLQEGANVILNARNEQNLMEAVIILSANGKGKIHYIAADILTEGGRKKVCDYLSGQFHALDVFVANLGSGKPNTKDPLDINEISRFFEINVTGNVGVLSGIRSLLEKGSQPAVVFVSSIVARQAMAAPYGYAAAKSAVITLSKYIARQWADDGIRVNCVIPGNVFFKGGRWDELRKENGDVVDKYIETDVPLKRFATPEEIANAIVFLSSERALFISGSSLIIDGGQSLNA